MGEFESHFSEKKPPSPDKKVERWSSQQFQEYLSRVALLGAEGAEPIKSFPKAIELDPHWHETIGRLREASRDRRERYTPFGLTEKGEWVLPDDFVIGERHHIIPLTRLEIKERFGIVYQAGDIHSHPRDTWYEKYSTKTFILFHLLQEQAGFSPGDFFRLVRGKSRSISVAGLVEEDESFFLFRTQETTDVPTDSPLYSQEVFSDYWARKYGYIPQKDGRVLMKFTANSWKMNLGIAENYNVALYRGKQRSELVRQYP